MLRPLLSTCAALVIVLVHGQGSMRYSQETGDCTGAIAIQDSIHVQRFAVRGFGNKLEIKENPPDHKQWLEREHHTTWYTFRAPVTTLLTFDIIPDHIDDDIDFLVFEGAVPGICEKIPARQVMPIRSNISRNDKSLGSRCGLSKAATEDYVRSGVGSSYSRAMEVNAGDLFYLVVDYHDRPRAGYSIHFHYDPPPPAPVPPAEPSQRLAITIVDDVTGAPVEAPITIDGMIFDKVVESKGSSRYTFEMEPYRNLRVACIRKGYMFHAQKIKGSTAPEVPVEIRLVPIAPGQQAVLDDIRFVGNDTRVMRQSESSLLMLVRFMNENPGVRIEIQGHVNGPTYKNKKEFVDLSTQRARTVYDFLLVNEVDPVRMTYVGFGNSKMIYPAPKDQAQSEANRRVEVKVVGM